RDALAPVARGGERSGRLDARAFHVLASRWFAGSGGSAHAALVLERLNGHRGRLGRTARRAAAHRRGDDAIGALSALAGRGAVAGEQEQQQNASHTSTSNSRSTSATELYCVWVGVRDCRERFRLDRAAGSIVPAAHAPRPPRSLEPLRRRRARL